MLERLEWDSDFFGFPVYNLKFSSSTSESLLAEKKAFLCYLKSEEVLEEQSLIAIKKEVDTIVLVDRKVTFEKEVEYFPSEKEVSIISQKQVSEELIQLGIQSGEYSRFRIDQNIAEEKFKELYGLWIQNSVNRQIAEEVYAYLDLNGKAKGLITLKIKEGIGDIGILAVHNSERGKGLGRKLVRAAQNFFYQKGIKRIQVVTQLDNLSACLFYQKCGFTQNNLEYIYHLWKN